MVKGKSTQDTTKRICNYPTISYCVSTKGHSHKPTDDEKRLEDFEPKVNTTLLFLHEDLKHGKTIAPYFDTENVKNPKIRKCSRDNFISTNLVWIDLDGGISDYVNVVNFAERYCKLKPALVYETFSHLLKKDKQGNPIPRLRVGYWISEPIKDELRYAQAHRMIVSINGWMPGEQSDCAMESVFQLAYGTCNKSWCEDSRAAKIASYDELCEMYRKFNRDGIDELLASVERGVERRRKHYEEAKNREPFMKSMSVDRLADCNNFAQRTSRFCMEDWVGGMKSKYGNLIVKDNARKHRDGDVWIHEDGYANINDRFVKNLKVKKEGCGGRYIYSDGMHRRRRIRYRGMLCRALKPDSDGLEVLWNMAYFAVSRCQLLGDDPITGKEIYEMAVRVMAMDADELPIPDRCKSAFHVDSMKTRDEKRSIAAKKSHEIARERKIKALEDYYDPNLSLRENVALLREKGYKISKDTISAWLKTLDEPKKNKVMEKKSDERTVEIGSTTVFNWICDEPRKCPTKFTKKGIKLDVRKGMKIPLTGTVTLKLEEPVKKVWRFVKT